MSDLPIEQGKPLSVMAQARLSGIMNHLVSTREYRKTGEICGVHYDSIRRWAHGQPVSAKGMDALGKLSRWYQTQKAQVPPQTPIPTEETESELIELEREGISVYGIRISIENGRAQIRVPRGMEFDLRSY